MNNSPENNTVQNINFSFKKKERLCSKIIIDKLFTEGKSFLSYPLKVVYLETSFPENTPVQAAFTVRKKTFKRAVHRNKIKRKIREAYRLNKHTLYQNLGEAKVAVFFIYIGKEIPDFHSLNNSITKSIKKILADTQKNQL